MAGSLRVKLSSLTFLCSEGFDSSGYVRIRCRVLPRVLRQVSGLAVHTEKEVQVSK